MKQTIGKAKRKDDLVAQLNQTTPSATGFSRLAYDANTLSPSQ